MEKLVIISLEEYNQLLRSQKPVEEIIIGVRFAIHNLPFYSGGVSSDDYVKLNVDDFDSKILNRFHHITTIIRFDITRLKAERELLESAERRQKKVPNWIIKLFNKRS